MGEPSGPVDYERVRRVPFGIVLTYLGLAETFKKSGKRFNGPCPIHHGTNKRQFQIDPGQGLWHCFGDCQRGGGGIELVAAIEGISNQQAAERIASWFSIPPLSATLTTRKLTMSETKGSRPDFKVYTVDDKDEDDPNDSPFWTRIGSAWRHKDGHGYNCMLAALPVNGRIVLREYTDTDAKQDEERKTSKTQRYSKK